MTTILANSESMTERTYELLHANKNVLELMANNRPFQEILNSVVSLVETFASGCISTVYFIEDGKLKMGAAPSWPEDFIKAVDGCPIGHNHGTCGHAAFHGVRAISTDVSQDEVWGPFRDWILSYGIKAAWSTPVLSEKGEAVATISMCWKEPRVPTEWDFKIVDAAVSLMKIAVERKKNEDKIEEQRLMLLTSSRLVALGEMSANLAHEINNPLAVILGRSSMIRRWSASGILSHEKLLSCTEEIEDTVLRITKIIKGLKSISKDGDRDEYEFVDVTSLVEDSLSFCRERFRMNDISLLHHCPSEAVVVECRQVQISQVILNLVNNAFDAVVHLPEKWVKIEVVSQDNNCIISISDSGKGIREDLRQEIMKPFFTTKQAHHGTGLGLSISKKIMDCHSGELKLRPDLPNTTFEIIVPLKQTK